MTEANPPQSRHRIGSESTHQDASLDAAPAASRQPDDSATLLAAAGPCPVAGLYLHIPFCFHKCHYCDFYSIVDDADRQSAFTDRLIAELTAVAAAYTTQAGPESAKVRVPDSHPRPRPTTLFIGGGTPTLLRVDLWHRLLTALHAALDLSDLAEFTAEANPETVTAELLDTLVAGGVNRLSIGAQSFNPTHLKTLERWHDPANVARSVALAHAAGIANVNLDLISAVPGQTLTEWSADLDAALALGPTHLSCYSLTFEPNTPLTRKLQLGRIDRTDEDVEAAMFEHTIDTLAAAGFDHYEVSNFARPGRRCLHNLGYWLGRNWLALGPSASGHLAGLRWKNTPHLGRYLATAGGCPAIDVERLGPDVAQGERLMLALRLLDGIDLDALDPPLSPARRTVLDRHLADGHLEATTASSLQAGPESPQVRVPPSRVRLTRRGLMIADTVLADLL